MSQRFMGQDGTGVVEKVVPYGTIEAYGTAVPADASVGYAPACIFHKINGTAGAQLYVNEGTFASSLFHPLVLAGQVEALTAATRVLTAADTGKIFVLNLAAGIAVTLPAAAAGLRFRFLILTTFTGAASIKSATGADIMIGHALMGNNTDNTVVDWPAVAASTFDTIDMFGTANSTGGIEGQEIEIVGVAANRWFVTIRGDAAGTEATPFADTVA